MYHVEIAKRTWAALSAITASVPDATRPNASPRSHPATFIGSQQLSTAKESVASNKLEIEALSASSECDERESVFLVGTFPHGSDNARTSEIIRK